MAAGEGAGAGAEALVLLSPEPLSLDAGAAFVGLPSAGAVASFLGITRTPGQGGRAVAHLFFEAYLPAARAGLLAIAAEAQQRFALTRVAILHRLGEVPLGQASLCVCVSSPHRAPALQALPWIVDQVKARATIFKKEVYTDGTHSWPANCGGCSGGGSS
jgi:molybdopterin synthase catalytic subunit